jgi:hypothetical protein
MTFAASPNLEGQLSVSVLTLVLTTVLPAVLLTVVIWVFWKAAREQDSPSSGSEPATNSRSPGSAESAVDNGTSLGSD